MYRHSSFTTLDHSSGKASPMTSAGKSAVSASSESLDLKAKLACNSSSGVGPKQSITSCLTE
eukprot:6748886-Lingulodinium_polyedra.AAC.1